MAKRTKSEEPQKETFTKTIRLFSPLDPITLATKLKEEMELSKKRTGRQVFGAGTEKKIYLLHAKRKGSDAFAPKLHGTMTPHESGTLIEGTIKQEFSEKPFLLPWNLFVGSFLLFGLLSWFIEAAPLLFKLMFTGIPLLMLVPVNLLLWNEKPKKPPKDIGSAQDILDWLAKTIDAKPVS